MLYLGILIGFTVGLVVGVIIASVCVMARDVPENAGGEWHILELHGGPIHVVDKDANA